MKKPSTTLSRKTVFIYKSLKTNLKTKGTDSTDPITATATLTISSTVCLGF